MGSSKPVLLPYQRRWVSDRAPRKVWVASRQIGKSFALSLEAVSEALGTRCDNLILSRSQRQSREMMRKVKDHLRVFGALSNGEIDAIDDRAEDLTLPSGSRIISLPASPDTVRGFSGNVFLDEFAFHSDDREIYKAVYPYTTRGYKIRICSTPNGLGNMFADIVTRPDTPFSVHSTTIHEAKSEGFDVDIDDLRRGIPHPDDWAQEYECRFVDEATALLSYTLIQSAEDALATGEIAAWARGTEAEALYLGVDIGRHRDLTVFWLLEKVGDVMWTRAVMVMHRAPFALQRERLYGLMDVHRIQRACVDATGLGMQLAEEARLRYGSRVEPVTFTGAVKEDLAITTMRRFQDRLIRVPASTEIREDLHSVQKVTTSAGNVRYDAQRSDAGHADRFWALALALHAGSTPAAPVHYERVAPRRSFGNAPEDDEPRGSLRRPAAQGSGGRRAW